MLAHSVEGALWKTPFAPTSEVLSRCVAAKQDCCSVRNAIDQTVSRATYVMAQLIAVEASRDPMSSPSFFPAYSTVQSAPKWWITIGSGRHAAASALESSMPFRSSVWRVLRP